MFVLNFLLSHHPFFRARDWSNSGAVPTVREWMSRGRRRIAESPVFCEAKNDPKIKKNPGFIVNYSILRLTVKYCFFILLD
jgi:hypothetical protein